VGFLNKKAAMDTTQLLIIGVLVVGLWGMGAFDRFLGTQAAVGADGTTTTTIAGLPACIGIDKTTVTLSATDKFDGTISVNGNHQYKINGGRATTVADGGTFDASPADEIKILWAQGNNSGSSVYLNSFEEVTVPCAGTKTYSDGLLRNGTITSRVFNEEGNLVGDATIGFDTTASTENETLATGDVVTLPYELQGTFERGQYANGGCVVADYNQSAYDDVIVDFDSGNDRVTTPDFFTVRATGFKAKTYSIPPIESNAKLTGSITIDSDDSLNPSGNGAVNSAGGDIVLHYFPNEHRLNSQTNTFDLFQCGENEDGNRVSNPIDSQTDVVQID
jgi:hypothetical protein|tara:strand:- start:279 stop:1280 length:1002 start_codon:yes stop_codon:yes gene_type:complete